MKYAIGSLVKVVNDDSYPENNGTIAIVDEIDPDLRYPYECRVLNGDDFPDGSTETCFCAEELEPYPTKEAPVSPQELERQINEAYTALSARMLEETLKPWPVLSRTPQLIGNTPTPKNKPSLLTNLTTKMTTLSNTAKRMLNPELRQLVKAGFLTTSLQLTSEGLDVLHSLLLEDKMDEMVKAAKEVIAETAANN